MCSTNCSPVIQSNFCWRLPTLTWGGRKIGEVAGVLTNRPGHSQAWRLRPVHGVDRGHDRALRLAVAKANGVLFFGLACGALGPALSVGRRGKPGPAARACRELPYPAPPSQQPISPRLGEKRGSRPRGAIMHAHGMTTPVRTNGDAPRSERICRPPVQLAAREEAGGESASRESASEEVMLPSALTPPDNARSLSPFEHRRDGREADMRDGVRTAPAFQGQSLSTPAIHGGDIEVAWRDFEPEQR
jgi:hypothetical protein